MYIKSAILAITGSTSPDVIGYKLYIVYEGTPLLRDLEGNVPGADDYYLPDPVVGTDSKLRWDLSIIPGIAGRDGVFDLGVCSVDDVGNESAFLLIPAASLDFVAPDAPTDGVIERS